MTLTWDDFQQPSIEQKTDELSLDSFKQPSTTQPTTGLTWEEFDTQNNLAPDWMSKFLSSAPTLDPVMQHVDAFISGAEDVYQFAKGVVTTPKTILSEAYDMYKNTKAMNEYAEQAPILEEQVARGEITKDQYFEQLDAITGERSLATLQTQFENKKISVEEYAEGIKDFANKNDKPLWDVGQTLINVYGISKVPLKALYTAIGGQSVARVALGEDPELVGTDVGKIFIYRQVFKLGSKTIGKIVQGAKGQRVNSLNGHIERRVVINPKKTNLRDILNKTRNGSFTTPDEQNIAQAIAQHINKVGHKKAFTKPFKVWIPTQSNVPVTPAGLLQDRANRVKAKLNALEKRVDFKEAKTPIDVANQLEKSGVYQKTLSKLPGKTTDLVKGKATFSPEQARQKLMVYGEVLYNTPEARSIRQLTKPNAAKKLLQQMTKEEIDQAGSLKEISGKIGQTKSNLNLGLLNTTSISTILDGTRNVGQMILEGEDFGPIVENFENPIYLSTREHIKLTKQLDSSLQGIFANAPKNYNTAITKFNDQEYSWPQKINILAHAENADNRLILHKMGITEPIIKQMANSLTEKDVEALNGIREHFNNELPNLIRPAIREIKGQEANIISGKVGSLSKEDYIKYLDEVPNNPKLSGYGAPRYYTPGQGQPIYSNRVTEVLADIHDNTIGKGSIKPKMSDGLTKHRKQKVNYKLSLDLQKNLHQHATDVSKLATMGPTLKRTSEYFNKIEKVLTEEYGNNTTETLRNWLNDLTIGNPATLGTLQKSIDTAKGLTYSYILSRNPVKIAMIQTASAPNAINLVGALNYQEALETVLADPSIIDQIKAESPIMDTRFSHITLADLMEVVNPSKGSIVAKFNKTKRGYIQAMTAITKLTDDVIAGSTYFSVKKEFLKRFPDATPEEAIIAAERGVGVSQPMTQSFYRPAWLRRDPLGKFALLYSTQRTQVYNQLINSKIAYKNGKIGFGEHLKNTIYNWYLPALTLSLIANNFTPEEEQAKTTMDKGLRFGKYLLGSLPVMSQFMGSLEYNNGDLTLGAFGSISASAKYGLKTLRSKTAIEGVANALQGILAANGINLQVPKNITAFVRSLIDDDPMFKRLIMSDYEAGYMTPEEELRYLKREAKKGIPKKLSIKDLLRDPWDEILK